MSSKKWKVDMKDNRNMLVLVAKDQYSAREVAESVGISHQSVLRHLAKLEDAGISASQACELDDKQLAAFLYPMSPGPKSYEKVLPDLVAIIAGLATAHRHS